jgi:hypothetical protein
MPTTETGALCAVASLGILDRCIVLQSMPSDDFAVNEVRAHTLYAMAG